MNKNLNWFAALIQQRAIKAKISQDPYYRFQNFAEIAIAAELGLKIDVNQATLDDWLRLPGISIHQGRHLVELNQMGVMFLSLEDLAAALNTRVHRLQALEPVLEFCYYDRQSTLSPQKIAIDSATAGQLAELPGLNPTLAGQIVENRQKQGKYRNLADLQRRLALDPEAIGHLMHYLQF